MVDNQNKIAAINVCRSVQREGSNVLAFETEGVVHEAFFLNKLPFLHHSCVGQSDFSF